LAYITEVAKKYVRSVYLDNISWTVELYNRFVKMYHAKEDLADYFLIRRFVEVFKSLRLFRFPCLSFPIANLVQHSHRLGPSL